MDIYDQHEQGERVRSWLKDNGTAIVSGVAIGLAAIFGYHQWQSWRVGQAQTAAELFEQARQAGQAESPDAAPLRDRLRNDYPRNGYAALAALEQAQARLDAGDNEGAVASLAWAREHAGDPALAAVAALRLARVELAAGKAEAALATVTAIAGEAFAAERAELRGDILAALGRPEESRAAYLEAQAAGPADPSVLAMKLAEHGATGDAEEGA